MSEIKDVLSKLPERAVRFLYRAKDKNGIDFVDDIKEIKELNEIINKAYEQGKADGEREMLEVILDMWYQFAYPCEDNESWSDGGLSALEMAGSVLVKNGILKYDNGIYTKLPDSERG